MHTTGDHAHLALARARFKPVTRALDEVSKDLKRHLGRSAVLQQETPMQQISQSASRVQYVLPNADQDRLSITFIIVGDEADCVLLQHHDSGAPDSRANPGKVDQQVYRLDRVDEIKQAVREKISAYLRLA